MLEGLAERLTALPRERSQALPALHLLHDIEGRLSADGLEQVAAWLHIPKSELYAVASSYTEFAFQPPPPGAVAVCRGVSCRIAGADALAARIRDRGRTVIDHECLFACAVAPVVRHAGALLGRATPERIP
jgi:NADH:ubiquinone oxidoreductase subunit E